MCWWDIVLMESVDGQTDKQTEAEGLWHKNVCQWGIENKIKHPFQGPQKIPPQSFLTTPTSINWTVC